MHDGLIVESHDFAASLVGSAAWTGAAKEPVEIWRVYLYFQAFASIETAQSYWVLRRAGRNHDCHILARTLFERHINTLYAFQHWNEALDLIVREMRKSLKKSQDIQRLSPSAAMRAKIRAETAGIARYEAFMVYPVPAGLEMQDKLEMLDLYKKPVGKSQPLADGERRINMYALFGLLSDYAHAGAHDPHKWNDEPMSTLDWLAIVTPVETAWRYFLAVDPDVSLDAVSEDRERIAAKASEIIPSSR